MNQESLTVKFLSLIKAITQLVLKPQVIILFCALILSTYKLYFLELTSRAALSCQWCLINAAIIHEIQFLLTIILLYLISLSPHFLIRISVKIFIIIALIITAIDIVLLNQFLVRFTYQELLKFIGEYNAVLDFIHQLLSDWLKVVIVVAAGIICIITITFFLKQRQEKKQHHSILIISTGILIFAVENIKSIEYHTPYILNSIEAFIIPKSRNVPYSKNFIQAVSKTKNKHICFDSIGSRPNIILIIFESLSMYHSKSFSQLNDWMPNLDNISKEETKYINFYANGITTEDGLISLFTGFPPIPKGLGNTKTLFEQYQNTKSMPKMLNKLGYQTLFFTTGNLNFLNKGRWLKKIGFQYIEGSEAPFYKGMKRFHFNAAPDKALYDRVLEKLENIKTSPFFLSVENVSTHHPYINPENGTNSEEEVFKYADKQLSKFINKLNKNNFFDNGYVIISSDHRAMVPIRKKEFSLYGDEAFARIPFIVLGKNEKLEISAPFSQTDLFPSLQHWLAKGEACIDKNQGIFLPTVRQKPECIYTRRSYDLNKIFIQCGNLKYSVLLDADQTRYIGTSKGSIELLNQVHRLRLNLGY
ncbi:MAG: LTA synthase family protein [Pseudomonadota bacterium]